MQTQTDKHIQPALHTHEVSYILHGSSTVHKAVGSHADLVSFADDMLGWDNRWNAIWHASSYIKRSGLKPIQRACTYLCINPVAQATAHRPNTLIVPKTERVKLAEHVVKAYPSVSVRRNLDHERAHVLLQDSVNVTCTETGISYSVRLPSLPHAHMVTLHPFSFFSNVSEHVRAFDKKGLHLDKQHERQIIAGMLLTALRHHKLLRAHDMVAANLCLQRAKAETLTHMVRFFVFCKSVVNMPSLRLIPEALYDESYIPVGMSKDACFADRVEIMLINYMRVCRGEGEGDTRHASVQPARERIKGSVRVYGGNMSIERRQSDANQKHAYILIEQIGHELHGQHETFLEYLEGKVDAFAFLGTEKRVEISNQIRQTLGTGNKHAVELARIFGSSKTETIELGIEAGPFTAQTQPARIEGKPLRFNLTSKIKA